MAIKHYFRCCIFSYFKVWTALQRSSPQAFSLMIGTVLVPKGITEARSCLRLFIKYSREGCPHPVKPDWSSWESHDFHGRRFTACMGRLLWLMFIVSNYDRSWMETWNGDGPLHQTQFYWEVDHAIWDIKPPAYPRLLAKRIRLWIQKDSIRFSQQPHHIDDMWQV